MKLFLRFASVAALAFIFTPAGAPQAKPPHEIAPHLDDAPLPPNKNMQDEILKADHARDLKDVTQLVELAEQLKQELEKNDRRVLSVASLKKTEEIEKLAKHIHSRLVHWPSLPQMQQASPAPAPLHHDKQDGCHTFSEPRAPASGARPSCCSCLSLAAPAPAAQAVQVPAPTVLLGGDTKIWQAACQERGWQFLEPQTEAAGKSLDRSVIKACVAAEVEDAEKAPARGSQSRLPTRRSGTVRRHAVST